VLAMLAIVMPVSVASAQMSGAIWTTDSTGTVVNQNLYDLKTNVYLSGGPQGGGGGPGLAPGGYYVQVTDPSGSTILGQSYPEVVTVGSDGIFPLSQLSSIVYISYPGTPGYADTTNPGGVYKVWVSQDSTFPEAESKTDNFKVKAGGGAEPGEIATLHVIKFYDANANGINDDGQLITGWKVRIVDDIDLIRYTPVEVVVAPDTYTVTEFMPVVVPNCTWLPTTPISVVIPLANGEDKTVTFGNVCLGPGGGHTLGFWSNKNGQATMNDGGTMVPELTLLSSLNLRDASGSDFDPANYAAFRTWLLSASATNMANMLSAQLAAMELNVEAGFVSGSALVYAPGTTSANALGFATVNAVMVEANTELGLHGSTLAGSPYRAYQEALKNALDNANNNKTFVQPTPCGFSFAP
jgi:hypothetical protein